MGLEIVTGMLAWVLESASGDAEPMEKTFESLNRVLAKEGLPIHEEPREMPTRPHRGERSGFSYSELPYLRRAVAYSRREPEEFRPVPAGSDAFDDPMIAREQNMLDSHIICHSDSQGFYLPIDFGLPIYTDKADQIPGNSVGSTVRARAELVAVAPLLGITLEGDTLSNAEAAVLASKDEHNHPLAIERAVWFGFFEATTASLRYKTAIVFQ